ncbi:hypothetical protein MBLNU459_g5831t1 [Dothideomycetes sp. NU459]
MGHGLADKEPPAIIREEELNLEEENSTPCPIHETSSTPHLDAQLRQSNAKECVHALRAALADVADDNRCAKCVARDAVHVLTVYVRDLRREKQKNAWSKQEMKALKSETKEFLREIKRDIKQTWKEKP